MACPNAPAGGRIEGGRTEAGAGEAWANAPAGGRIEGGVTLGNGPLGGRMEVGAARAPADDEKTPGGGADGRVEGEGEPCAVCVAKAPLGGRVGGGGGLECAGLGIATGLDGPAIAPIGLTAARKSGGAASGNCSFKPALLRDVASGNASADGATRA